MRKLFRNNNKNLSGCWVISEDIVEDLNIKFKSYLRGKFTVFQFDEENNNAEGNSDTILPDIIHTIFPSNIIEQNDLFLFKKTALAIVWAVLSF